MKSYNKELEVAQHLAVEAGKAILPIYYGAMDVSWKEDQSPVTNADILANRIIQDGLQKAFPSDGIVSEELETVEGSRCWYIDPIDGTRGFIEHTGQFAIHIGLAIAEKAALGVVYKPAEQEMYFAVKNGGAFRKSPYNSSRQISVQDHKNLIAAMEGDSTSSATYSNLKQMLPIKRTIISGSEGLRIAKVAEGIADLHFTIDPSCSTWDVCAPQAIAEEAGAYVSFTDQQLITYLGQRKLGKNVVVANSKTLAEKIYQLLNEKRS